MLCSQRSLCFALGTAVQGGLSEPLYAPGGALHISFVLYTFQYMPGGGYLAATAMPAIPLLFCFHEVSTSRTGQVGVIVFLGGIWFEGCACERMN